MIPDKITGVTSTSTPIEPDHWKSNKIQTGLCVIYWKNVTLLGYKVESLRTRLWYKTKWILRQKPSCGWVRCTVNRSHSTPCKKAEFEHLQIYQDIAWTFLPMSGKICHSSIKKVKRQPTLIISFSQHSTFFEGQSKNSSWNPTRVICYLGSVSGSLWQNSPHKDAFFCISLANIDQCWITCTFKVE